MLKYVSVLSLSLWLGAIFFFAIAVAPSAFAVLPSRELAGNVVNRTLGTLHYVGLVCGLVFLLASLTATFTSRGRMEFFALRHVLVVAMLALTLISQFGVGRRMSALRADMVSIDRVAADDPRRVEFNRLHKWSTRIEVTIFVMGLLVLGGTVRELGSPRP